MKKFIFLIITIFILTILAAETHNEDDLFNVYQQNQSFENFQKAINHYNTKCEDVEDHTSVLMMSYLYTMELHRNLDLLKSNIDSLNTRTKFSYANLLLEIGQFDESVTIYDQLNTDFPKWSCPWRHKGEALMKQQNYKDAEIATLKAIETREDHFDAYTQLATIQKELKKYEEALKSLNKGLSYYSSDPEEEISDEEVELLKAELKSLIKE